MALAALPALWFGRFDPARALVRTTTAAQPRADPRPTAPQALPITYPSIRSVRTAPRRGGAFGRLLLGEARILRQGDPRWWWLTATALVAAGLALPLRSMPPLLLVTWVWPVLIWSRLGTQLREHDLETLMGAYPSPGRRLLAEWTAGLALTAVVGLAPAVRMGLTTDWSGVAAWAAGATFIPALAMALGVLSRTNRLFQAVYLPLWYAVVNGIAGLDYIGAVRLDGQPVGPHPLTVIGISAVVLASAFVIVSARHARR